MGFEDPQQALTNPDFTPCDFFGGWGDEEVDLWKPKAHQDLELEIRDFGNISIDFVCKSVEISDVRLRKRKCLCRVLICVS